LFLFPAADEPPVVVNRTKTIMAIHQLSLTHLI